MNELVITIVSAVVFLLVMFLLLKLLILPLSKELNHKIFPEDTFMRKFYDNVNDSYFKYWYVCVIILGGLVAYFYFTGQF